MWDWVGWGRGEAVPQVGGFFSKLEPSLSSSQASQCGIGPFSYFWQVFRLTAGA